MRETRRIPTGFWLAKRRILPYALLLSVAWAIFEFSKGRPGRAIYPLAFGAYFLFSYLRTRRRGEESPKIPGEYRFYEVYAFFGGCFIVGVIFLVLAISGVAHIGIVIGVVAMVGAAVSACAIVWETHNRRRQRRGVSPPVHSDCAWSDNQT
jgi:hypothetical protein